MSVEGVDYAFPPRPSIAGLAAAGKVFACRYGGPGTVPKHLTPAEAEALTAAGIAIIANAEGSETGLLAGRSTGESWARSAEAHFARCGMPPGRPIYFSVDFDVAANQWGKVADALRGAASVIGIGRVGVYGGRRSIEWARRDGVAKWFWQTYAWSNKIWVPGNHIEQHRNGVQLAGAVLDLNRALKTDYGQWMVGGQDMEPKERAALENVNHATYALMTNAEKYPAYPDNDPDETKVDVRNEVHGALAAIAADVDELKRRPPVTVDPVALETALGPQLETVLERVVRKVFGSVDNLPPKMGI